MKIQNKWEKLFEEFIESIDFRLCRHKENYYIDSEGEEHEGEWSLIDIQCVNLGGIEEDRFDSASGIIDRLDIYINDSYYGDLQEELEAYEVDLEGLEVPCMAQEWLELINNQEFYQKNISYFENHRFEFDVLDMIVNHCDEINLENVRYEEEE